MRESLFHQLLQTHEKQLLKEWLKKHGWNVVRTAKALNMYERTLRRRIAHHGLERPTKS